MLTKFACFSVLISCFGLCTAQQVVSTGGFEVNNDVSINWILGGSLSGAQLLDTKILNYPIDNHLSDTDVNIKVYPVPAYDFINIEMNLPDTGKVLLELYDEQGIKVLSTQTYYKTVLRLSLTDISSGLYILKIMSSGRLAQTKKIIKK